MIDLKLDQTGDLLLEKGELQLIEEDQELAQYAKLTLQTNLGEWFLDPMIGMDFEIILQKNPDEDEIRTEITRALMETGRFSAVESVDFSYSRSVRTLGIYFTATGVNGETVEDEVIINA
ncbi:DUF2634 domain-containing protein [Paenibacillus glucanolyticus]|uniref:DUF2634 domain-containing protein n=1 Tax=Paenibacillus glucanolyticus TaxID=59843 RepID=UPI0035D5783B